MTRSARRQSESNIYHVVARGVSRCIIFEDDADRRCFLDDLEKLARAASARVLAWCLMSNHYHILIELALPELSQMMKALNSSYAGFFNTKYDRVGHLFQGRFKSEPVDSDEYLLTVVRYIHQNPERAEISPTETYAWSSYKDYLGATGFTETSFVLGMFDGIDGFVEFHRHLDMTSACCDAGRSRRLVADENALLVAKAALGSTPIEAVVGLDRAKRDEAIRQLRMVHLSVRQIERLTGVSRGIIARVRIM